MPQKQLEIQKNSSLQAPLQELNGLCNAVAQTLNDGQVKIDISNGKCEMTIQTPNGADHITATYGYQEISRGDIRGLPLEQQKKSVMALRGQGLSQNAVARRLNVSQSRISQIENSKQYSKFRLKLSLIGEALCCPFA